MTRTTLSGVSNSEMSSTGLPRNENDVRSLAFRDGADLLLEAEQPAPTEVVEVEGESGGTPALWYRWAPEP